MAYEEINPTLFSFQEEGDSIEGILVQKQEDVGQNESMLYSLETQEGVKNVWGATVLDEKMSFVDVGEKIRITFLGKAKDVKKGKNPAKLFKVEVDKEVQKSG